MMLYVREWSQKDTVIHKQNERDDTFWNDLYPKLSNFQYKMFMPEYVLMRIPRRLTSRAFIYEYVVRSSSRRYCRGYITNEIFIYSGNVCLFL